MTALKRYHILAFACCDEAPDGAWCGADEAIAALESAEADALMLRMEQQGMLKMLADAEAREAELRAEVERLRGMVPAGEPIAWTDGKTVRLAATVDRYETVAETHTIPLYALPAAPKEAPHD